MACPICAKPAAKPFAPFCSRRCADVDLSRWLKGSYAIPGSGAGEEEEDRFDATNSPESMPSGPGAKGMDRE
ncbi:MAG: hypothetical protein RIR33_1345 [Pseudomonadota bacterium]|jgi:endogenous inhibitor of DNA gyrase (YacG/DUF329 family)